MLASSGKEKIMGRKDSILTAIILAAFVLMFYPANGMSQQNEVVDNSTKCDAGLVMGCCDQSRFMTGVHFDNGQLLCAQFRVAPTNPRVDRGTRRLQQRTCPVGFAMVGV